MISGQRDVQMRTFDRTLKIQAIRFLLLIKNGQLVISVTNPWWSKYWHILH